jgi:5-methyltetrahydrofolate--homocysteine methyltransferase
MAILDDLRQSVIDGDVSRTEELIRAAEGENLPAEQILKAGLIRAMAQVGCMYETGECFVPEMLIAARAMKSGLELLRPRLTAAHVQPLGKVILGTVQGDLHDIGKNLVGMMLEGTGFEVVDLGTDVSPEEFVRAAQEHAPDLVACSALLTTTMVRMKDVIAALDERGLRDQVKVIVGGAPVTESYAGEIGADLYAPDAASAAKRAAKMIAERKERQGSR